MRFLGLFALVCVVLAAGLITHGEYATAAVALCVAVFSGFIMRAWKNMPTAIAWGTSDSTGTTVRMDKRVEFPSLVGFGAIGIGFAVGGVFAALNKLAILIPNTFGRIWGLTLGWVMGGLFVVGIVIALRRPGLCSIRLTPDGFTFAEGFTTTSGTWADVTDISNNAPAGVQAPCPITMEMRDDKPKAFKNAVVFGLYGRVVLAFVQFYWQHPEYRGELTDDRALNRLQAMQREDGVAQSQH
ncbi:hypothetical protein BOO86_18385 [Mycobacterium sp. CBMA 234]|uniref:hypothetical protein n=1 Tax=Mycolicibacterium sp. CBMA 234 TaxID=1918495 RepID=UPI0012DD6C6B|nr:hypothetical protein [Mycolicibacterium sp. CBMA 234]MUL66448.1 hypothetical protein [Mycolicibacterium sp. CBMA 234]